MFLKKGERLSSYYGQTKPRWHIKKVLTSFDSFSQQLPGFNLKGQTEISTAFGGALTLLIMLTTLTYANIKFIQLESSSNPNISEYVVFDHFQANEEIELNSINFRFAFTVEGQFDEKRKVDSRYTKLLARHLKLDPKNEFQEEKIYPVYECTEADYAQFYPIIEDHAVRYNNIRYGEDRGFYCIDWEKEDVHVGVSKVGFVNYVDIILAPCNFIGNPEYGLGIAEECEDTLSA